MFVAGLSNMFSYIVADIDECDRLIDCATCNNSIGSFDCQCNVGFAFNPSFGCEGSVSIPACV